MGLGRFGLHAALVFVLATTFAAHAVQARPLEGAALSDSVVCCRARSSAFLKRHCTHVCLSRDLWPQQATSDAMRA